MNYAALPFILVVAGLLLLAAELLIPSSLFFILGLCAIVGGVVMAFLNDPATGWMTLIGVFIVVPAVMVVLFRYWPHMPVSRRLFLAGPEDDATLAHMPVNVELEQLRGRSGRALSDLRPAGVVEFDGRRIDCITEGMMVAEGQWVRCIDVKAGKVIVRPAAKPDLGSLEAADFSS